VKDEQLKNLLQSADAAVPPAVLQQELLKRIRPRARRAAMVKIAIVTLIAAAVPIVPIYFARQKATPIASSKPGPSIKDDLNSKIAALEAEAAGHELTAQRIEQQELFLRLRQREARAAGQTFEELTANQCITAQLMVNRAEDLSHSPDDRAQAAHEYQRVIELFSQTPQAAVAAQRLREMKTQT
jgi:hypothetical protein